MAAFPEQALHHHAGGHGPSRPEQLAVSAGEIRLVLDPGQVGHALDHLAQRAAGLLQHALELSEDVDGLLVAGLALNDAVRVGGDGAGGVDQVAHPQGARKAHRALPGIAGGEALDAHDRPFPAGSRPTSG